MGVHTKIECEPRVARSKVRQTDPALKRQKLEQAVVLGTVARKPDLAVRHDVEPREAADRAAHRCFVCRRRHGEQTRLQPLSELDAERHRRIRNCIETAQERPVPRPPFPDVW